MLRLQEDKSRFQEMVPSSIETLSIHHCANFYSSVVKAYVSSVNFLQSCQSFADIVICYTQNMFRNSISLPFKLLGIPLKLDISFLFVLPLFAWLIGSRIPAYIDLLGLEIDPVNFQDGLTPYFLGFIAALGLFISVVIHELGHAVTAKAFKVKTKDITLWFLGGVAQLEEMPRKRGVEAVIAIVGPITSLLLAGLF